jgi:hypothetical protein
VCTLRCVTWVKCAVVCRSRLKGSHAFEQVPCDVRWCEHPWPRCTADSRGTVGTLGPRCTADSRGTVGTLGPGARLTHVGQRARAHDPRFESDKFALPQELVACVCVSRLLGSIPTGARRLLAVQSSFHTQKKSVRSEMTKPTATCPHTTLVVRC